jgi:hypothetical protein
MVVDASGFGDRKGDPDTPFADLAYAPGRTKARW